MKLILNIKKRYAYAIIGLLVLAVGVFVVNALTPGVAPNPGHLITEVAPPSGCGSGQVLEWSGSSWGCVNLPVDTDTDDQTLSVSGQTLSINSGNSVTIPSGKSCRMCIQCYGEGYTTGWACTGYDGGTSPWTNSPFNGWGHNCDSIRLKMECN